jgi:hypothetical protein
MTTTDTPRKFSPQLDSKTQRRDWRMKVRHALGVGSDPAPGLMQAMRAAHCLDKIVQLASNGRLRLAVQRTDTLAYMTTSQAVVLVGHAGEERES